MATLLGPNYDFLGISNPETYPDYLYGAGNLQRVIRSMTHNQRVCLFAALSSGALLTDDIDLKSMDEIVPLLPNLSDLSEYDRLIAESNARSSGSQFYDANYMTSDLIPREESDIIGGMVVLGTY